MERLTDLSVKVVLRLQYKAEASFNLARITNPSVYRPRKSTKEQQAAAGNQRWEFIKEKENI